MNYYGENSRKSCSNSSWLRSEKGRPAGPLAQVQAQSKRRSRHGDFVYDDGAAQQLAHLDAQDSNGRNQRVSEGMLCNNYLAGNPLGEGRVKQNTLFDSASLVVTLLGISMPVFWLGLLLIILFSVKLNLLPTGGADSWASYICSGVASSPRMMRAGFPGASCMMMNTRSVTPIMTGISAASLFAIYFSISTVPRFKRRYTLRGRAGKPFPRRTAGDYIASITSWSPSNCFTYLTRYASSRAASMPGALQDAETDALIEAMK